MGLSLDRFYQEFDQWADRIPLHLLEKSINELQIGLDDIRPYLRFNINNYRRNLLHSGPMYQALALCWRPGQRSPIHDHAGSSRAVRIIQGTAVETIFEQTADGHTFAVRSRQLEEGESCASQDSDIHQVSNLQPDGQDLITLHVYSPPLLIMGVYSLTDTKVGVFDDPVMALSEGAGI